jgi:hypothetical protein
MVSQELDFGKSNAARIQETEIQIENHSTIRHPIHPLSERALNATEKRLRYIVRNPSRMSIQLSPAHHGILLFRQNTISSYEFFSPAWTHFELPKKLVVRKQPLPARPSPTLTNSV